MTEFQKAITPAAWGEMYSAAKRARLAFGISQVIDHSEAKALEAKFPDHVGHVLVCRYGFGRVRCLCGQLLDTSREQLFGVRIG